jgi:hypothetical protein
MPLSFPLDNLRDLVLVPLVDNYLTGFRSIRHDDIGCVIKRLDVQLPCRLVERSFDSYFRMLGKFRHAERHLVGAGRRAAIACQTEICPAGPDQKIVAESRVNATSKRRVARPTNAIDGEASAYRKWEYMLLAAGPLLEAEDTSLQCAEVAHMPAFEIMTPLILYYARHFA